jgi:hypothetical protein
MLNYKRNKMVLDEIKEHIYELKNHTNDYVETTFSYYKLLIFKVVTKSIMALVKFTILILFTGMTFFFFSLAAAFALGNMLNNMASGFLIVAVVYLILSILIYLLRETLFEKNIIKKFSKIFFNDD